MIINRANLDILYTSYNTAFRQGLVGMQASGQHAEVAMEVPSSASEEKYGWIGALPGLREWVGERVVHSIEQHDYAIANKDFELTVAVNRNDIDDDKFGVYAPRFTAMGEAVGAHYDELVWPMLKAGFGGDMGLCYDGQYFFDTDHPYEDAAGNQQSYSNAGGGDGTPWFLVDTRRTFRPIILQKRKSADMLTRREDPTDESVWNRNEYEYGVHCRDNVGFGFWQLAYGSKQALTAANYKTARKQMLAAPKERGGRPLGVMPNKLIVPPALEGEAREVLKAERNAAGATNVWRDTAEAVVVPWLA